MSTYNLYPKIDIKGYDDKIFLGYENVLNEIKSKIDKDNFIVVLDCYVGVDSSELLNSFKNIGFDNIIFSDDYALKEEKLTEKMQDYLTDDRVFGIMNTKKLKEFFIDEKLQKVKNKISTIKGKTLIYGVGASLITTGDLYIYADISRWEIQLRYRAGMTNWNVSNANAPILEKYKRGFFMEWRIADRHKMENYKNFDYVLDTNKKNKPKMITAEAFFNGLLQASQKPFRLVPYFDSGVWGGQWLKQVCGLDRNRENFAWGFDGVPEENSILLNYGNIAFETPAINLVFCQPENLLGERVYARFGKEFPIRFDFLDTMEGGNLSLQVHPLTEYIQETFGMHYTQDESYYILDAKEDSVVYLGVKEGIDREQMILDLKEAQNTGKPFDAEKYVNKIQAKKHDHFLIPAGTIHCSGKNTVVLEISATPYIFTFKLWDWGRLGLDGLPRPIHIEHGEKVINFGADTKWVKENLVNHIKPIEENEKYKEESTGLSNRHSIETRRHIFKDEVIHETFGSVNVLNLVEGEEVTVESLNGEFEPFVVHYAETFIIPACVEKYKIKTSGKSKGKQVATIKAYIR